MDPKRHYNIFLSPLSVTKKSVQYVLRYRSDRFWGEFHTKAKMCAMLFAEKGAQLMKRIFCVLLSAVLVCLSFSGCEAEKKEKLRICFDVGGPYDVSGGRSQQEEAAEEVLGWLDSCLQDMGCGVSSEDVQREMLRSVSEASPEDWEIYALPRFIQGGITDEKLAEIVHAHYEKLERLLDES